PFSLSKDEHNEAFNTLLRVPADNGMHPLLWATYNNEINVLKILLNTRKLDTNSRDNTPYGQTPLSITAEHGHEAVVELLLGTGRADINSRDIQSPR
ncbi:hypothetical protein LTR96_011794, partial [Exophiala xenobiotica]